MSNNQEMSRAPFSRNRVKVPFEVVKVDNLYDIRRIVADLQKPSNNAPVQTIMECDNDG